MKIEGNSELIPRKISRKDLSYFLHNKKEILLLRDKLSGQAKEDCLANHKFFQIDYVVFKVISALIYLQATDEEIARWLLSPQSKEIGDAFSEKPVPYKTLIRKIYASREI